jgi:acyl-coenzyme A thioesterase PaaI-like protein
MVHEPAMTVQELERFLAKEFPQVFHPQSGLTIEALWRGGGRVRQAYQPRFIRPGGTISGPTMMALADFAMYVGVLASVGAGAARRDHESDHEFPSQARRPRPGRRMPAAQARQAACGRRSGLALRWFGGPCGPCHVDLFDPSWQVSLYRYTK